MGIPAVAVGVGECTVKEKMVGVAARNCARGRTDLHVGARGLSQGQRIKVHKTSWELISSVDIYIYIGDCTHVVVELTHLFYLSPTTMSIVVQSKKKIGMNIHVEYHKGSYQN
jgi:hypothetical protein